MTDEILTSNLPVVLRLNMLAYYMLEYPLKCTTAGTAGTSTTIVCLNFSNTLPVTNVFLCGITTCLHCKSCFISIDDYCQRQDAKCYRQPRRHDVHSFITGDGHVVKAVNTGTDSDVDTVIIEDMQVFEDKSPVVNLYIYRKTHNNEYVEKLIVVSRDEIKSVSLHRCHLRTTCSGCVALQDPYCSWTGGSCVASNTGQVYFFFNSINHMLII